MSDGKVEAKEYGGEVLAVSAFRLSIAVLLHAIAYGRHKFRDEFCSPKCGLYPTHYDILGLCSLWNGNFVSLNLFFIYLMNIFLA